MPSHGFSSMTMSPWTRWPLPYTRITWSPLFEIVNTLDVLPHVGIGVGIVYSVPSLTHTKTPGIIDSGSQSRAPSVTVLSFTKIRSYENGVAVGVGDGSCADTTSASITNPSRRRMRPTVKNSMINNCVFMSQCLH
jgi:hypothetical protein